jgi:hypothetical protein
MPTLLRSTEYGYIPFAEFDDTAEAAKEASKVFRALPKTTNPDAPHRFADGPFAMWEELLGTEPTVAPYTPGQRVYVPARNREGKFNAARFLTFRKADRVAVVILEKYGKVLPLPLCKIFPTADASPLQYSE